MSPHNNGCERQTPRPRGATMNLRRDGAVRVDAPLIILHHQAMADEPDPETPASTPGGDGARSAATPPS